MFCALLGFTSVYRTTGPLVYFPSGMEATLEPRCEKMGLRGIQPGPTQTGLYSHRRCLEA